MKNVVSFLFILIMKGLFGDADGVISVKEGDSVTLHTGATERDDVINWWFGPEADRIARINRPANKIVISDGPDGRFRERLKLDHQTGSLTITDMRTTDSGIYKVTFGADKTFSVTVEPADTVGSISLMEGDSVTLHTGVNKIQRDNKIQWRFQNSSVAEINKDTGIFNTYDGADGRFIHRLQLDCFTGSLTISNIGNRQSGLYEVDINSGNHTIRKSFTLMVSDAVKSVLVKEGDSVTLHTAAEIQNNDLILWMFGDTVIAEIHKAGQQFRIYPVERFRDRLKLDHQTGSLNITNTRTTDSGDYELKINSSRRTINRRFTVTVTDAVKKLSVKEGDSVTLHTDTEIQNNDLIQWMLGDTVIAEIHKAGQQFRIYPVERFRHRLLLDHQTGSLTITNTRTTDSGDYELKISSSRRTINRRITVTVTGSDLNSGLSPDAVAGIVVDVLCLVAAAVAVAVAAVVIYRHKISKLGSHRRVVAVIVVVLVVAAVVAVIYHLHKISELKGNWYAVKKLSVKEGDSVTLHTDTEIQNNDLIQWMLGDTVIAEIHKAGQRFHIYPVERFRHRLLLDHQNGSLTITNTRTTDSGDYELKISSSRRTINRRITVTVTGLGLPAMIAVVVGVLLVAAVCCYCFKKQIINDACCRCCKKPKQESNRGEDGNMTDTQSSMSKFIVHSAQ